MMDVKFRSLFLCCAAFTVLCAEALSLFAQAPPYDVFPAADPPYYRVRFAASSEPNELIFGANYTLWIPPGVERLRGVVVHQHGCGEGSCRSGLTGAYDLHWQALAAKHDCALLSPAYEQPEGADCQRWCDPRNGSNNAFQKALSELAAKSNHPELSSVPWALWGHSGGGHWCGGMVMLYPDRVVAAWLRSGVPLLEEEPGNDHLKAHTLPDAAVAVPVMCNLGVKEGYRVDEKPTPNPFGGVWPANQTFFRAVRLRGGLIGIAIDPLTSHECGNQRYLAIPWLDACLTARLPTTAGEPLRSMPANTAWFARTPDGKPEPAADYAGDKLQASWLPNEAIAKAWTEYTKDTQVIDETPPPAPNNVAIQDNMLTWQATADVESGLAYFIIERDGEQIATVPDQPQNPFGRPVFQNLQYSDTPPQPLADMKFIDPAPVAGARYAYRVIAVNTVGKKSEPTTAK